MKTATTILLLAVGLFFIHADALKCRQSSCVGVGTCGSRTVTCGPGVNLCFVLMKTSPLLIMTRGCITESNCQIMKAYEPSTRCCKADLCN